MIDPVVVPAAALIGVLNALRGPDYMIRELRAIASLPGSGYNPLGELEQVLKAHMARATRTATGTADAPKGATELPEAARDMLRAVTAALVGAISVIERAEEKRQKPSRVVGSDAMFAMMLNDYQRVAAAAAALDGI